MKESPVFTCEQLVALDADDRRHLAGFASILANYRGCMTPAEEFIRELVRYHSRGNWSSLTPDSIMEELNEFREKFDDAVETAKLTVKNYPAHVFAEKPEANWGDEKDKLLAFSREDGVPDASAQDVLRHAEFLLIVARRALREFPTLVLSEDDAEKVLGLSSEVRA